MARLGHLLALGGVALTAGAAAGFALGRRGTTQPASANTPVPSAGVVALPSTPGASVRVATRVAVGAADANLWNALRESGLLSAYSAVAATPPGGKPRRVDFVASSTGIPLRAPSGVGYVRQYAITFAPALGGGRVVLTDRDAALRAVEARVRAYLGDPRTWSHDPLAPVSARSVGGGSVTVS